MHVKVVPGKPELVSAVEVELAGPELVSAEQVGHWRLVLEPAGVCRVVEVQRPELGFLRP